MDKIIKEFRILAEERWYHLENGDSKRGNKCFDKMTKIVEVLKEEGRRGKSRSTRFLLHSREKMW